MDGPRKRWYYEDHADTDKAVFHRIMQRFRPIIPKPAALESGLSAGVDEKRNKSASSGGGRKLCKKTRMRRRIRKLGGADEKERDSIFTTLQLLPADQLPIKDSDDILKGSGVAGGGAGMNSTTTTTANNNTSSKGAFTLLRGPFLLDRTAVETWVTLERVTGNCMDGRGLGCTDDEMITNLERDTCPGFISDGANEVKWVNMAYRRMVMWEEEKEGRSVAAAPPPQVVVKLVAMADLAELAILGFACRVRVQYYYDYYYNNMSKQCRQIVVPCDVWRMEFGGLAWRLDVQAALSLGRR